MPKKNLYMYMPGASGSSAAALSGLQFTPLSVHKLNLIHTPHAVSNFGNLPSVQKKKKKPLANVQNLLEQTTSIHNFTTIACRLHSTSIVSLLLV